MASSIRLTVTLLGAVVVVAACAFPPVLIPTNQLLRDVYVRGPGNAPVVALTFDDGPNGRCTADILDALAQTATPATFFVLGANVAGAENAALVARMVREGHEVGLHGWAHSLNSLFDRGWTQTDIDRARDAVVHALRDAGFADIEPRYYRPPFGFLTAAVVHAAATRHLAIVEWTVSVEDWRNGRTAAELADAVIAEARPGDILVLHDGDKTNQRSQHACVDRPEHAEAVRRLIPGLAAHGLRVARLAEVLTSIPPPH